VMAETFSVRPADDESLERASSTDLDNPFLTASYLESQRMLGREGWLLSLDDARAMRAAALCFLDRGRLRRTLMIPSSPPVDSDSPFWSGVRAFIAEHAITDLELSTFASPQSRIPRWPGELERIDRTEFAMPLKGFELLPRVSKRHRERISKGRRKGLVLRRDASDAAIDSHIALHITSMDRRKSRGESVSLEFERAESAALLASGAGELFQAMLGDHVWHHPCSYSDPPLTPIRNPPGIRRKGWGSGRHIFCASSARARCRQKAWKFSTWAAFAPRKKAFAASRLALARLRLKRNRCRRMSGVPGADISRRPFSGCDPTRQRGSRVDDAE
jgi:hypothetical protein